MRLEQWFEVDASLDRVWEALVDVERVAPCLPGAVVTGRNDDGSINGTFTIKIGPTTASYAGKLEIRDINESGHSATIYAQGSDRRGQGGATATIVSTLSQEDGGTHVDVLTDYHITGRLARFGRGGMIEDISERLLREFAGRLQTSLSGGGQAAQETGSTEAAATEAGADKSPRDETEQPTQEQPRVSAEVPEAASAPTQGAGASTAPPPQPPAAEAPQAPAPPTPPPAPAGEIPPKPEPPRPGPEAAPPPPPPPPAAEEAPEPVNAPALVGSALFKRIRSNPKPLLAIAGTALLLRLLWRRR